MSEQNDETTELKVGDYVLVDVVWADEAIFGQVTRIEVDHFFFLNTKTGFLYASPIDGDWSEAVWRG